MEFNRCCACMEPTDQDICPHCGYPADPRNANHHLPVGTLLRGRYQLGQVLGQGGFGITYGAFDTKALQKVAVKELFPARFVTRSGNHRTVTVNAGTNSGVDVGMVQVGNETNGGQAGIAGHSAVDVAVFIHKGNSKLVVFMTASAI